MKQKNMLIVRIAMALVWAVAAVGTNGSASAALLNSEDFEAYTAGAAVSSRPNWTGAALVQASPGGADGHGLVLCLVNSDEQKWDFGNIPDTTAYIQMDLWLPTDSARTLTNDVVDSTSDTIYTAFARDGADTISQVISGTWTQIASVDFNANQWFTATWVLDQTTSKFDLYLGATQVATGVGTWNPVGNGIDLVSLSTTAGNGTTYVDNIKVGSNNPIPEPSSLLLLMMAAAMFCLRSVRS